ncbi:MAG: C39 family peptidase [Elusimicrobiota bacterium]|nr:C39 family peptidase [Elusimicrobiota bacterium]
MPCKNKKQLALLPSHNLIFTGKALTPTTLGKNLFVLTSKPIKSPFIFDSLVLSVSAKLAKEAALLIQASVKTEKGWSGFYKLAYISKNYKKTFTHDKDAFANIAVDTLLPKGKAQYFKYQITVLGHAQIGLICAALTNAEVKYNKSLALETLGLNDFELKAAPLSQREFKDKKLQDKICAPACLTMVLNYYGKKTTLAETIKNVYDDTTNTYGVWPLNTALAAQFGLNACVVRASSIAQIEGELYKGKPVIVSLSYKKGELKNALQPQTQGHLVVIIGIDKNGNIIALDPAAKTAKQARIVYSREQFAKAWLKNKKGVAFAIED